LNSAGQAAIYLLQYANEVEILIRKESLESTKSAYLIEQIAQTSNILVSPKSEIVQAYGTENLGFLDIENLETGAIEKKNAEALYIFIGAKPMTDWIAAKILRDEKDFLVTGRSLNAFVTFPKNWKKDRNPYLLGTSIAGIFTAGDVRSGAMNRVASAVGDGVMAISMVHRYLGEG
jgi:thioredoxin reductase (NADPH)